MEAASPLEPQTRVQSIQVCQHNTAMLKTVGEVSRQFVGREAELNDALRRKYKSDLKTMAAQQQAAEAAQRERDADAAHRLLEDFKSMAADEAAAGAAEGGQAAAPRAQEQVGEAEGDGGALVSEGEMDEEVAQAAQRERDADAAHRLLEDLKAMA